MTLGQKQERFTQCVSILIQYAIGTGYKCRIREVQRTKEQQELYIQQGRSTTMNSKHLNSLAVDMYFTIDGEIVQSKEDLQHIGDFWESLDSNNKWGGNWHSFIDTPHFEYGG